MRSDTVSTIKVKKIFFCLSGRGYMYGKCQGKIWEKSGNLELNDKWHLCVISCPLHNWNILWNFFSIFHIHGFAGFMIT